MERFRTWDLGGRNGSTISRLANFMVGKKEGGRGEIGKIFN